MTGSFDETTQAERFEAVRLAMQKYYQSDKWILRCKWCKEIIGRKVAELEISQDESSYELEPSEIEDRI